MRSRPRFRTRTSSRASTCIQESIPGAVQAAQMMLTRATSFGDSFTFLLDCHYSEART